MDLESRVKAYAEEARRVLLQRALEEKGRKGSKAFWQGYTTNGNGVVRLPDGKYKVVKVIGNIVLPKESTVYIDEQNTVEVGFRKELPMARGQSKQQLKPTVADKIKRPLILFVEEEGINIGDFVMYYGYYGYLLISGGSKTERYFEFNNVIPTGTDTLSIINSSAIFSDKPTYYFTAFGALASCFRYVTGSPISYVKLTNTPYDEEVIADSGGVDGSYRENTASTHFGTYSGDYIANIEYRADEGGSAKYSLTTRTFTLPETQYYVQSKSNDGQEDYVQIDLQSYFTDTVVYYEELHAYTRKRQPEVDVFASTTYLIFQVRTVDFSYEELYVNPTGGVLGSSFLERELRYRGKLEYYYLHLKIDHSTGSIDSRKTLQTQSWQGSDLATGPDDIYSIGYRVGRDVFAAMWVTHYDYIYSPNAYVDINQKDEVTSPRIVCRSQDILSQTFEGDWLYEWRNVQVGDFVSNFTEFLKMHYHDGIWYYRGLNGGEIELSTFKYYEPGETESGYGGLPADNTASSITSLMNLVDTYGTTKTDETYFDGSVEGVPDEYDNWTLWAYTVPASSPYTESWKAPNFTRLIPDGKRNMPWISYVQAEEVEGQP